VTVNGAGGLTNSSNGEINIEGSASVQATLDVANAAAGFGTAGVEIGTVMLENDALLEFKSGQIATVNGTLWLDGAKSFVADAGKLTANSALTGLTSVSGNFVLQNGAKVTTTGNLSVTGNASVEVDGNFYGGGGGSSLTFGGTLTNSSASANGLDVGDTGLTSADTLTVKGAGGLTNSGDINIEGGSASSTANLLVTNDVTSGAGTIFLNSFGDLTAAAVNIDGGKLEGTGAVTGALNDIGGTVCGGSLNGTPATLNVSGAYSQSGSGILQTDINTGNPQQSSIIAVSGSPGTPDTPGSVNLSGGTLLIDDQSSLVLNTPYTVMTFAANDLYGQFAQVQTEGTLGSHTGNGNSVNLGNGDTLEVLYNEAAGDIQVELVSTPASTSYTWDVGSGTWNALSGGDWNPPGAGTTPSNTSDVTIGGGGGGTVTLAQDQTIASLTIISGYTLSGSSDSISATGNVAVLFDAVLSIDDANVGGTFLETGSATFAGGLTINGAGRFLLSNGSLTGGISGTGTFESVSGTTDTLSNVAIYHGTTFTVSSGATTNVFGTTSDSGAFVIDGTSGNAIVNLGADVSLTGGGAVILKSGSSGSAFLRGSSVTLTNANDTIEGAGSIGDSGALTIVNEGTVNANSSGQSLSLGQGGGALGNSGTFEATGGGHLLVAGALAGAGQLKVGANSTVELAGATSESTTFLSAASATLLIDNATTTTYSGVLNSFAKGDIFELGNTNATTAAPTSFNGIYTTLTVDLSSGGPLTYALAGNLTGDTFGVTHSGSNSSIAITAPAAFAGAYSLLTDPVSSSSVESDGVFGASNGPRNSGALDLAVAHNPHA
jgi:hypothetical protein